jgi:RMKL-like, methyltransferase domain
VAAVRSLVKATMRIIALPLFARTDYHTMVVSSGGVMQQFKSVYFVDHPAPSAQQKNLKIAFGPTDTTLYECVVAMSSEELRRIMGYSSLARLKLDASRAGQTINAYCLQRLKAAKDLNAAQLNLSGIQLSPSLNLDPIQATFRGGATEPLHAWYPFLEGYSPEFVSTVLDTFAPRAHCVLDPFGGAGTTPIVVARRGGVGVYCELNPMLQLLTEAKVAALVLSPRQRRETFEALHALADELRGDVETQDEDMRLKIAYKETFGVSEFFPPTTLSAVLKLRTWLDLLDCTAPLVATITTVAAAAALLSCSNLIRRGDVRFRKGPSELAAKCDDYLGEVANRIHSMASSIATLVQLKTPPILLASDAKQLKRVAPLNADAAVMSPPYLNGTNYYRNAKLELWFLRALHERGDLSRFRAQTVTAGINDVTVHKRAVAPIDIVVSLVARLRSESYDRRIPQMVLSYFSDMNVVIGGLETHLRPAAPLLMDIGDSAYGGVHVDTPALLSEMLVTRGWRNVREIVLRKRLSRSGQALRQVLVVADAPPANAKLVVVPRWKRQWATFKRTLPHQSGDYARRNWGSPLHSLCSYQGKMKPSLAKHLIDAFTRSGETMLDPFGGVGTIPFEAAMAGVKSWIFDISPAAVPIATAKLVPTSADACRAFIAALADHICKTTVTQRDWADAANIRFNGALPDYFHRNTFTEILKARSYFHMHPPTDPAASLVFASLLHVLHGNRPYALSRRSHPITPFAPTGKAQYKNLIEKVREKMERALAFERPRGFTPGIAIFQDATEPWPIEVDNVDTIITSPPFFDSTRFYLANWMRLWFAGWTSEDFKRRPLAFIDERQKEDFAVYRPIIRQARERLKQGGVCVFHLGKSKKCDMAAEIEKIARPWFARSEIFSENVEHCESHGIRDKGTVVEHHYLVLY